MKASGSMYSLTGTAAPSHTVSRAKESASRRRARVSGGGALLGSTRQPSGGSEGAHWRSIHAWAGSPMLALHEARTTRPRRSGSSSDSGVSSIRSVRAETNSSWLTRTGGGSSAGGL